MKKILITVTSCVSLFYSMSSMAHEEHHTNLAPHEHGKLTINLALDDKTLEIELDGPAASITGFEYVPISEADKKTASLAKQQLANPQQLFAIATNAQCELTEKTIKASVFGDEAKAEEYEHDKKVEHHHSDVEAHYSFSCKQPSALKQLDFTTFFKAFPLTKQISIYIERLKLWII